MSSDHNVYVKKVVLLTGLSCVNCAAKIERETKLLKNVKTARLDFVSGKLILEVEGAEKIPQIIEEIARIASKIEDGVNVVAINNSKKKERIADEKLSENNLKVASFIVGVVFFGVASLLELSLSLEILFYLTSYLLVGGKVVLKALKNIIRGQIFDENFLMFVATAGAFAIRQFPEAVAVMLFYQIGEFFQESAVSRSRRSISALMDIRPDYANLKVGQEEKNVSPEEVIPGQVIIVKPGEKVPLDGTVIAGSSVVDTSALTGEFVPRKVEVNSSVLGGYINKNGVLTIQVSKAYEQSTVAKILDLVENAAAKKAPTENFITKFARYYTPIVVVGAALLAILPPLFLPGASFTEWLNRALVFLVISCPCALVISIPLSFFGGIGGASRRGILIKGSNYLEGLNSVRTMVFDKTGTLTEGVFEVTQISPIAGLSKQELLEYAAAGESYSSHPIASSIIKSYGQDINKNEIKHYEEISGYGVKADYKGKKTMVGSARFLAEENIIFDKKQATGTVVHLAVDHKYSGYIVISDRIKKDTLKAIHGLRKAGIKRIVMLTGDNTAVSEKLGEELGLDEVFSELLPDQKVTVLEELEKQKDSKSKLVFIGDGINDAPVLARAEIGIAMGGLGSDAAIEAADIVLMTDEPSKLLEAFRIAHKTRIIVWQNILLAFGIKACVLILGAMGMATMWEAVFADVGVAVMAIFNAMRILKTD